MVYRRLAILAACSAALAGCGGGGGSTPPMLPPGGTNPGVPGGTTMSVSTTYTAYEGTVAGETALEIAPLNDRSAVASIQGAQAVPGAIIQYPDGSLQIADAFGNFDASQSPFAQNQANDAAIYTNPNLEPEVVAFAPGGAQVQPADAYVQIIPTDAATITASFARAQSAASAANVELSGVSVFPRGYALFDGETRTYHAVGLDSNGGFASLANAPIQWSVTEPQGCSNQNGAGKIAPDPNDPARAVYVPPTAGSFPAGCQDVVVAQIGTNGTTYSGSGNAFYYDPSTAVSLQGIVNDSTGKPVAHGIVDLYGGGREFYHGKLYAIADGAGSFKRLVPSNRTLYPFAGNPVAVGSKTTYAFFTVNPTSIPIGAGGSTATQNLNETAQRGVNPFKALPPLERAVRDSWLIADLGQDGLPFGGAQTGGTFASGTIEYAINNPGPGGSGGTLTKGAYKNWSYTWDSSGKIAVFQQPASQEGGRHILQITTGIAVMQYGGACPAGDSCFNFLTYYNPAGIPAGQSSPITNANLGNGAIVATDGSFAESANASQFAIALTRNVYSAGHQTIGSPLYVHAANDAQMPGSLTMSVSDVWKNAAGEQLATFQGTRTQGTGSTLFSYDGNGTRTYYKADGSQNAQVAFTLANGTLNADRSGAFTVTYASGLPNATDNGTSVSWTLDGSGTPRATGTVDNPNVAGLQTGHVATFTLTPGLVVTVTTDPNLGGNAIAFHL